jgi:RNA polymerase sigma-70 factor (ECF subfamily)
MAIDIEELYRRFGPMVLRRCRRLLRDEAQAVDAMHDVFVQILRRRERLDDAAPAALLLRAATNVSLNRLRTRRRRPEDLPRTEEEAMLAHIAELGPEGGAESRSLARRILERVFHGEPESTRLIATLLFVDHLTLEEVAAEVGLSVSGVRKRVRTLKSRLPVGAAVGEAS